MQFIYDQQASLEQLRIEEETYKYLFKVRRHSVGEIIAFRNFQDDNLYWYAIEQITKQYAILILKKIEPKKVVAKIYLHLAWCIVDPKTIEKQLPYLNELGVEKLSFVYADYSQKSFKINFEKLTKIAVNSSQQCGRSSLMQFELFKSVDEFLKVNPESFMFNFSENSINNVVDIQTIIVGCEGGFSKREIKLFESSKIVGVKSNLILRSETAVGCLAAKLIV